MLSRNEVRRLQQKQNEQFLEYESEAFRKAYNTLKEEINDALIEMASCGEYRAYFVSELEKALNGKQINAKLFHNVHQTLNLVLNKEGYIIEDFKILGYEEGKININYALALIDYNYKLKNESKEDVEQIVEKYKNTDNNLHRDVVKTDYQHNEISIVTNKSFNEIYKKYLIKNIIILTRNEIRLLDKDIIHHFVDENHNKPLEFKFKCITKFSSYSEGFKVYVLEQIAEELKKNGYNTELDYKENKLYITL